MKFMMLGIILYIGVASSVAHAAEKYSITEMSAAVVYLHKSVNALYMDDDGVMKELWLKGPEDEEPLPQIKTMSGTGFFINYFSGLYLVTASHVAKEIDLSSQVTIAGKNDVPETISLKDLSGSSVLFWVNHPIADVAVLALKPTKVIFDKYLDKRFLPAGIIEPASIAPPREVPICVIGFPKGLGVTDRFSPLTLQTSPASGILIIRRFDTKTESEFFIVQDPSTGGFSGAPVFDISRYGMEPVATPDSGTRLYGLVHGTISDDTGGKLGAVVPSHYILETLQLAKTR
ncbi:MAG: serine protease [Desulfobacteraceae bacterium]|nr:MAG: serine protease [Desulfobacteraceae bacterium]